MKTLTLLLFCWLAPFIILRSQDMERQISVRGQVTKEFTATKAMISLTISEQQPNEYARISYVPFALASSIAAFASSASMERSLLSNVKLT